VPPFVQVRRNVVGIIGLLVAIILIIIILRML
jgi:hypothetical protein